MSRGARRLGATLVRRATPMAVLLLLASCSESSTEPSYASVAGTWTLQTVNGTALPFTLAEFGEDKVELLSETVVATSSGTFTQSGVIRLTTAGSVTTEPYNDSGTYTLQGSTIIFTFESDDSSGSGNVDDDVVTVTYFGNTYVYRR
jgi:hypothetical protein